MHRDRFFRAIPLGLVLPVLVIAFAAGCGGALDDGPSYQMGVPYRAQAEFNFCVPASILMWRLYDGLPEVSQYTIFNNVGGAPCDPYDAAYGVALYTNSGSDAYLDLTYSPTTTERDELVSRQITSADRGIPIMPIVYPSKSHVGIINGGKYADKGTYWEWEFLYFHNPDPAYGANYYYTGGRWLDEFCVAFDAYCGQVISVSGTSGWSSNLETYEGSVSVYGGGGGCLPGECGPLPV